MKKKNHSVDKNINKKNLVEELNNNDSLIHQKEQDSADHQKKFFDEISNDNIKEEFKVLNLKISELDNHNEKLKKEKEEIYKTYINIVKEKQDIYHMMKDSEERNIKKCIQDIIYIIKQLDYVLQNIQKTDIAFNEINNLQNNIVKRLSDIYDVTVYKPEVGQKFNPSKERVISVEKTQDPTKNETISSILSNAFIKDNKVIDEALVCVFQSEKSDTDIIES